MFMIVINAFSQTPPITTIPTLTCQEGTIFVPVTVKNFTGVGNISLSLKYDPSKLIYQESDYVIRRFNFRRSDVDQHQKCIVRPNMVERTLCIGHLFEPEPDIFQADFLGHHQ